MYWPMNIEIEVELCHNLNATRGTVIPLCVQESFLLAFRISISNFMMNLHFLFCTTE